MGNRTCWVYNDKAWGFNIRCWLRKATAHAAYYSFPETFPTKQAMMDRAAEVAPQYLADHLTIILRALAGS